MKYLLILLFITSCAVKPKFVKYKPKKYKIKTRQELIIECFEDVRRLGGTEEFAGRFCMRIFK